MSASEVREIIRDCTKCNGSRTQIINTGDGAGDGIIQCGCVRELERYLHKLALEELDELGEEFK